MEYLLVNFRVEKPGKRHLNQLIYHSTGTAQPCAPVMDTALLCGIDHKFLCDQANLHGGAFCWVINFFFKNDIKVIKDKKDEETFHLKEIEGTGPQGPAHGPALDRGVHLSKWSVSQEGQGFPQTSWRWQCIWTLLPLPPLAQLQGCGQEPVNDSRWEHTQVVPGGFTPRTSWKASASPAQAAHLAPCQHGPRITGIQQCFSVWVLHTFLSEIILW